MSKVDFQKPDNRLCFSLYKYYGNIKYAIDAITNKRIHLELPKDYNDIFDSTIVFDDWVYSHLLETKTNMIGILKKVCPHLEKQLDSLCKSDESIYLPKLMDELLQKYPDINESEVKETITNFYSNNCLFQADNNKISCFSEIKDSLLMWAYYANNYKGVCIEFDFSNVSDLKKHIHKVQYSQNRPNLHESFDTYFWKSIQWSHEQEWRIVAYTDDEYLSTPCIKSIILGARIEEEDEKKLIDLARENNIKVYRSYPSNKEYRIIIEENT